MMDLKYTNKAVLIRIMIPFNTKKERKQNAKQFLTGTN